MLHLHLATVLRIRERKEGSLLGETEEPWMHGEYIANNFSYMNLLIENTNSLVAVEINLLL